MGYVNCRNSTFTSQADLLNRDLCHFVCVFDSIVRELNSIFVWRKPMGETLNVLWTAMTRNPGLVSGPESIKEDNNLSLIFFRKNFFWAPSWNSLSVLHKITIQNHQWHKCTSIMNSSVVNFFITRSLLEASGCYLNA